MSNPSITADKTPWYQWDTGITVTVSGFAMTECHFANRKQGTAYVQAVINGVARVPDELLQVAAPIKAYGYVSDGAGGQTYVEQSFDVIARNIPADYTYTKTAQKTIRDAEQARDQAVQAAKYAKASELAADDSAVEASNSAQSAGESASAAATSASNAAKSAGDAAKSASDAKAAADKAVEDASDLLKTYTDNAKTSADNAATSARNAADAASSASGSASAAAQSATDASNAKVAAQTAKAEAATSASNAATSASNAESSATAAAKSASDAAASVNAINVIAPLHTATSATADNTALAIGNGSHSYGSYSIAIGASSDCGNDSSVAMGDSARTTRDAEFSIGSISGGRYLANVKSPELDTDATNKKYTDDNDTKTLTEAKKYTDANTSNALVGTVSGKLLHVEDAWPSKPLSLTIEGAYKQDGTPSPENPVPIDVIENPVLWVTGKNLQKYPFPYNHPKVDNLNGVIVTDNGDGSVTATGTPSIESYYNFDFTSDFKFARGADVVVTAASNPSYHVEVITDVGNSPVINSITKLTNKVPNDALKVRSFLVFTAGVNHNVTVFPQFEIGTTATEYAPYVGASLPITLPAEHPYLAALPDGTHDEIVIDKYGNVSLVARVAKTTEYDINSSTGYEEKADGADFQVNLGQFKYKYGVGLAISNVCVKGDVNKIGQVSGGVVAGRYVRMTRPETVTDIVSARKYLIDIGFFAYIALIKPVTYHLGKLDIPALPETISNVWIEAELTTNMSMTYKRDINIAFDSLVQAVVAAAAGE